MRNLLTAAFFCLCLAGCYSNPMVDVAHEMRRQAHQVEVEASKPYYGTGVVARVSGDEAGIKFASHPQPHIFAKFVIVRGRSLVGHVKGGVGELGDLRYCKILDGDLKVGELALGWQREEEFIDPRAERKSNTH